MCPFQSLNRMRSLPNMFDSDHNFGKIFYFAFVLSSSLFLPYFYKTFFYLCSCGHPKVCFLVRHPFCWLKWPSMHTMDTSYVSEEQRSFSYKDEIWQKWWYGLKFFLFCFLLLFLATSWTYMWEQESRVIQKPQIVMSFLSFHKR